MKIKIEIDENLIEDEVVIHCASINEEVTKVQKAISEVVNASQKLVFYKDATEYYLGLDEILFFETEQNMVFAHTGDDRYEIHHRLYELEELLPSYFMRVSKSGILNTRQIFSIDKNLYASSTVCFRRSHKQVFVSRHYYKPLIEKLESKRTLT